MSTSDSIIMSFEVKGEDFFLAGEASSVVKNKLKLMCIPEQYVRRAAIAMYEAEMNMVLHGGGGIIEAEICDEYLKATFEDKGPGIDNIEFAMKEGTSTATDEIRALGFGAGMGLPNIKRNCDNLSIHTEVGKGTTVTIEIYFT